MKLQVKIVASAVVGLALSGCSHTGALRKEIGVIEGRLNAVESEIANGTTDIGQPGKDIRAKIAYRPFQAWAQAFGTKTVAFRQQAGGGDLDRQSLRCRPFGTSRPAYRVFIHEDKSTKIDLTVGPLAIKPTDTGLEFTSKFDLWAKTQFAAAGRAPCLGGWSPTVNVGAEVRSRPTTVMALNVKQSGDLKPSYNLVLTAPKTLDLEFRTGIQIPHVGDFDIRHTFRPKIDTITLMSGDLDLLVDNSSEVIWPDGKIRVYKLSTVSPVVKTDRSGIGFETDLELKLQDAPTAQGTE